VAEQILNVAFFTALFAAALRFATPILLAALGEIFTERAGILNLGLEGVMLGGTFSAFLTMVATENPLLALVVAVLVGLLLGVVLGLFYVTLQSNQVVIGILFTLMMVAFTGYAYRLLFGDEITRVPAIGTLPIPGLEGIPVLGSVLFDQSPLTYLALVLVPVASVVLYKTKFGLKVRAVGEHPRAADTLGVSVPTVRYIGLLIGCGAAGAGGAFFALQFGSFLDAILAGRGYIALAIVIFGRWNPTKALLGAVLFGLVDALALRMQALSVPIPNQFLLMLPYLLTILALLFSIGARSEVGGPSGPKALNTPYER
jgi:simple sugar transport system permease protein